MKKKKTEGSVSVKRKTPPEELVRNSLYVEYRKLLFSYQTAVKKGDLENLDQIRSEMEAKRDQFLAADASLPADRRIWKQGFLGQIPRSDNS